MISPQVPIHSQYSPISEEEARQELMALGSPAPHLSEDEARKELKRLQAGLVDFKDATEEQKAQDRDASLGRGVRDMIEFPGDIWDIVSSIPNSDVSTLDAANPISSVQEPGDKARSEFYGKFKKHTDRVIDPRTAPLSHRVQTGIGEYGPSTVAYGGAKNLVLSGWETLGAALGGELSKDALAPYGEMAEGIGELIGAITGALSPHGMKALANKLQVKFTGATDDAAMLADKALKAAVDAIMEAADDAAAAKAAFLKAFENGDVGTMATMMRDAGVADLETYANKGKVAAMDALTDQQIRDRGHAGFARVPEEIDSTKEVGRIAQENMVTKIGKAKSREHRIIDEAQQGTAQGLTESRKRVDEANYNLADAQQQRDIALAQTGTTARKDDVSEQLTEAYNAGDARFTEKVDEAWAPITGKDAQNISVAGMGDALDDMMGALETTEPGAFKAIESVFKSQLERIRGFGNDEHPSAVWSTLKEIKDAVPNQPGADLAPYQVAISNVTGVLEGFLSNHPTLGPVYKNAFDKRRQLSERYRGGGGKYGKGTGGVGGARGANTKAGEERLLKEFETRISDTPGKAVGQQVLASQDPLVIATFEHAVRVLATEAATAPKPKLAKFLNDHDSLLTQFPELHNELRGLEATIAGVTKQTALTQAVGKAEAKVQTGLEKTLERTTTKAKKDFRGTAKAIRTGPAGDMARRTETAIDNIIKSENATQDLIQLKRTVGKTPADRNMFRDALAERFIANAPVSKRGLMNFTTKANKAQFNKLRKGLEDSGWMTKAELDDISDILDGTEYLARRANAGDPVSDFSEGKKAASALLATTVLKFAPGNSLMIAGVAREYFKTQMLRVGHQDVKVVIDSMIEHPELFAKHIKAYQPKGKAGWKDVVEAVYKDAKDYATGTTMPTLIVQHGDEENE